MEYADGGDLVVTIHLTQSKIVEHKDAGTIFEEKDIWKITYDVLKGERIANSRAQDAARCQNTAQGY
jgi:FtsP/CotA-like multicopper oxidase with cupredoxin domain